MKQKLFLGFVGLLAFIVASAGVSIIQMIVGSMLPNTGPDPAGKMEPTPQQRAKAEYQQQVKEGKQPPITEAKSETKSEPKQTESPQVETQQPTETQPEPQPVVRQVAPPPPTRGPGNFDAPEPYYAPPSPVGPGNM